MSESEARLSIEVVGLQNVLDAFSTISRGLDTAMVNDEVANVLRRDADRGVPVLTGALRASGRVTKDSVVYGSSSVPYANPIHWGWPAHNIVGRPWLRDAMEDADTQRRIIETAQREAQKLIDTQEP